jgi:hypothetical protein
MSKSKTQQQALSSAQQQELLTVLRARFEKNGERHERISWNDVEARLQASPAKVWSLQQMEATGGEPDVVGHDTNTGEYLFYDCSAETPAARRSLCYDPAALEERKEYKPTGSAVGMAEDMGIQLLTEAEYFALQKLGQFDKKTSSWLQTPLAIRKLGGAIFGDCRYDHVFIYHNGAQSYYAARGFRGSLKV